MEPTANEQGLAAWLDVNVEDISNDLHPDEERPVSEYDRRILCYPDKIASDLFWSSRGLLLIDKFLDEHWKQQIQSCANIRFEDVQQ